MGSPQTPETHAPEQDHDAPQDMAAFGVALTDDFVDRDDVAAGNLGAIELAPDLHDDAAERMGGGDENLALLDVVALEGASDGAETQATVLFDADASPELNVSLTLAESDEGLDGGEEGPAEDESRADVSTAQLAEEELDDDDAPWKAFSEQRHIAEKLWKLIAERGIEAASASQARIALTPSIVARGAGGSAGDSDAATFEDTFEGAMTVTAQGIVASGTLWLPFAPTALAKLHDDVLVVATDQSGTCHVYAGRLDEAPYLVFVIDREEGDTEVRVIVEATDDTVLLRGPFGEIELHRS